MDTRLKEIADNFEAMKIDLDGKFPFHCTMCGKCCINREDILLTPRDIYRMAEELETTPQAFVEQYGETYVGGDSRMPIVRLRPRGTIKRCPLLKDRKCMVHNVKPTVCAMFPIGRCLRLNLQGGVPEKFSAENIEYIFTAPDCGDETETHTVREWLRDFGISDEDEFFLKWQKTILDLSGIFRAAEKKTDSNRMIFVWNLTFAALYLNYEMEKDFLPQFDENAKRILEAVRKMLCGGKEK